MTGAKMFAAEEGVRPLRQRRPFPARALRRTALALALSTVPLGCGLGGEGEGEGVGEGTRSPDGSAPQSVGADATDGGFDPVRLGGHDAAPGTPPGAARHGAHTEAGQSMVEGEVGTAGAGPLVQVVLLRGEGAPVMLGRLDGVVDPAADPEHPLAELARLVGATVRVMGRADAFEVGPMQGFGVTGYEILAIEGVRPLTGLLVRGSAGEGTPDVLEPDGGGPLRILRGVPEGFPADRTRVWVIGEARRDTVFVEGFGVLRGPPPG